MMTQNLKEPTPDQCTARATVAEDDEEIAIASWWYPQMGGYCSVSIIIFTKVANPSGRYPCFDALVWHDGEFPFSDHDGHPSRGPVQLHHCSPEQFIRFGEFVGEMMDLHGKPYEAPAPPAGAARSMTWREWRERRLSGEKTATWAPRPALPGWLIILGRNLGAAIALASVRDRTLEDMGVMPAPVRTCGASIMRGVTCTKGAPHDNDHRGPLLETGPDGQRYAYRSQHLPPCTCPPGVMDEIPRHATGAHHHWLLDGVPCPSAGGR